MLDAFVAENREEIIRRCRAKVEMRSIPTPTPAELEYGIPQFLDQLVDALQNDRSSASDIGASAARHGRDLHLQGFTVSQVVHDYGDVCQSITDLALQLNAPISVDDFRTLNRCLDDAIASAVTEYGRGNQSLLDAEAARDDERLGSLRMRLAIWWARLPSPSRCSAGKRRRGGKHGSRAPAKLVGAPGPHQPVSCGGAPAS